MAESSQFTPTDSGLSLIPVDFRDAETGRLRRVLLPPGVTNYEEGIPVGLDLGLIYPDCPVTFMRRLQDELYAQGLIEPKDFVQPGAPERTRAALMATVQHDALEIVAFAREILTRDN